MRIQTKVPVVAAIALVVGMPTAAYCLAPVPAAAHVVAAPGSKLGGFNTEASGAGAQIVVSLPGIAPVGNATKGDFIQASLPFASSTASTGPSTSGLASPVWPGDVAANAGNDLQTFAPSIPAALVKAMNYPIVARSVYPAQVNVGQSGTYQPPGGGQANVGTATTKSAKASTRAVAVLNDTSPLGAMSKSSPIVKALSALKLSSLLSGLGKHSAPLGDVAGASLVKMGSSTTVTTATVDAGSVLTKAQTDVSNIVVAGVIRIDGVSSVASAVSDGKHGTQHSALHVGKVTVAGVAASIGPKGIRLKGKPAGSNPVATANQVLAALKKAKFTIRTIAPSHKVHGKRAATTSGALQIGFKDSNVPNLQQILPQIPVPQPNSIGLDVTMGLSQVAADASGFLPVKPLGGTSSPPVSSPPVPGGGGTSGVGTTGGSIPTGGGLPGGNQVASGGSPGVQPIVAQSAAAEVFGIPIRVVWVVVSLLLAFMGAGLMLAYANWQLLRGRTS